MALPVAAATQYDEFSTTYPMRLLPMSLRRYLPAFLLILPLHVLAGDVPNPAVERMKADLQFLTSDECEGRGPGTKGIDLAADRIAATFKKAGLKGGMKGGSYFQPFQLRGSAKLGRHNVLTITTP